MGREEDAQKLARSIVNDSGPWKSISEFDGDLTLFSEEIVRNTLYEKTETREKASEITRVILSKSKLGCNKDIVDTLGLNRKSIIRCVGRKYR